MFYSFIWILNIKDLNAFIYNFFLLKLNFKHDPELKFHFLMNLTSLEIPFVVCLLVFSLFLHLSLQHLSLSFLLGEITPILANQPTNFVDLKTNQLSRFRSKEALMKNVPPREIFKAFNLPILSTLTTLFVEAKCSTRLWEPFWLFKRTYQSLHTPPGDSWSFANSSQKPSPSELGRRRDV